MARLKKKTIIFGSSSDIGRKIKKVLNKDNILELNSKELDLSNIEEAKKYNINISVAKEFFPISTFQKK